MKSKSKIGLVAFAMALALIGAAPGAIAGDNTPDNPAGTWKVTFTRDGKPQAYQPTLKLKLDGDTWSGTFTRRRGQQDIEMPIQEAKIEAGEISFTVSIPGNGVTWVRKFHGKLTGDTIKEGNVKEEFNGTDPTVDHPLSWEAKRVAE